MKKPYVKPQLYYENFELSQHVAACGWDMNQADKHSCQAIADEKDFYKLPATLFVEIPPCNVTEENAEGYCYETSRGGFGLFNS